MTSLRTMVIGRAVHAILAATVLVVLPLTTVATVADPAAATPSNCVQRAERPTDNYDAERFGALCRSGTGWYRGWARCSTGGREPREVYTFGPRLTPGSGWSWARCTSTHPYLIGGGMHRGNPGQY